MGDNSKDEDTKILDLQPEQALKTTLRLGKNVSKRLQKRWVAAALQISSLSSRVEGMKHIDLIAYSNAIPSRVAGVYDQWPVLQQGMKQFQESAKPYQGLALQQLDNVRQFGSLQLVKLNLQVKPVMLAGSWLAFSLIFLKLENNCTQQPDITNLEDGECNIVLRFANTTWFWISISFVQWLWRFTIYERYISEPPELR